MSGISKKLLQVIGNQSAKSWAEQNGLPVQTVHEWIKHDRKPRGANFQLLIQTTGIAKEWWTSDSGQPPPPSAPPVQAERLTSSLQINKGLLHHCMEACRHIYGAEFSSSLEQIQIGYAVDCYNVLIGMIQDNPTGLRNLAHLTREDIVQLMKISIKLGKLHSLSTSYDYAVK